MEDGSVWSLVRMVSCSLVSALASRVYRVVFAEVPDGGQRAMREDLSGDNKMEK